MVVARARREGRAAAGPEFGRGLITDAVVLRLHAVPTRIGDPYRLEGAGTHVEEDGDDRHAPVPDPPDESIGKVESGRGCGNGPRLPREHGLIPLLVSLFRDSPDIRRQRHLPLLFQQVQDVRAIAAHASGGAASAPIPGNEANQDSAPSQHLLDPEAPSTLIQSELCIWLQSMRRACLRRFKYFGRKTSYPCRRS